jgi:hypothetical protein
MLRIKVKVLCKQQVELTNSKKQCASRETDTELAKKLKG